MRTDYCGHDREYQRRRAAGYVGWETAEGVAENIREIARAMEPGYVPKTGRALELGCGAGDLTLWLATLGYEVSGVDIAPTALAWAREKAQERGLAADFQIADVRDLAAFPDASFDFVLDGRCLHCLIGADRALFLAAARRVLKPGGVFHITTMCGEPVLETAKTNYDSATRCTLYGDIATRYFGRVDDILAEVRAAGLCRLEWEICPANGPDAQTMLLVNATRGKDVTDATSQP